MLHRIFNSISAILACAGVLFGLTFSANAGIVAFSTPSYGLAAYWSFDSKTVDWNTNKTFDSSGNGNTGTLVNMTKAGNSVTGKTAQALFIDGNIDSIGLVSNPILNVANPSSACVWVKNNDISLGPGGWDQTILNFYTNGNNGIRMGNIIGGALYASYRVGGTYYGVQSTSAVFANNQWAFVCYVWDGAAVTLYANGAALTTTSNVDSVGIVNTLGARDDQGDGNWYGTIDELRVFNRALSVSEIQRLFQSSAIVVKPNGAASSVKLASVSVGPGTLSQGLVGYWPFDGSTLNWRTNTATDVSGNNGAATLINMSTTSSPVRGKLGQALNFDGSTSVVESSAPGSLSGSSVFSVSFWAIPASGNANVAVSIRSGTVDSDGFNIVTESAQGGYGPMVDWPAQVVAIKGSDPSLALVNGKYHFYVFVSRSATDHELFVDGISRGTSSASLALAPSLTNVTIGAKYSSFGGAAFHSGPIDDVRIYNRALSSSEMQQLYNMGR